MSSAGEEGGRGGGVQSCGSFHDVKTRAHGKSMQGGGGEFCKMKG